MSASLNPDGASRSELSIISATSAKLRADRVAAPAKITSSIPPPRTALGRFSPITQRNASSRLDLPQPLGPTTPVSPSEMIRSVGSTKLLNPFRRNLVKRIRPRLPCSFDILQDCRGQSQRMLPRSVGTPGLIPKILRWSVIFVAQILPRGAHKSLRSLPQSAHSLSQSRLTGSSQPVTPKGHGSPPTMHSIRGSKGNVVKADPGPEAPNHSRPRDCQRRVPRQDCH